MNPSCVEPKQQLEVDLKETPTGFEASVLSLKLHCAANPRSACLAAAAKLHELALRFEILAKQEDPIYCKSVLRRINLHELEP
jgi:hypothetical protein